MIVSIKRRIVTLLLLSFSFAVIPAFGSDTAEIRVGVFTVDPKVVVAEGKIMDYLSKKTGIKFSVMPVTGYEKAITKLETGVIDAAIFGSAPAYISIKRGIAEAIARPEARKSSVYYGYWMTLKDSGLEKVEEFKGKRFAYVDKFTSAGYLFPRAILKERGFDPDKFFNSTRFVGTHEAAVQMLLTKSVEGCAAKDSAYKKFIDTNIELKERIRIIEVGGPFPERSLMISTKVDDKIRRIVRQELLNMENDAEGRKVLAETERDRYVETTIDSFEAISKIIKVLKLHDL